MDQRLLFGQGARAFGYEDLLDQVADNYGPVGNALRHRNAQRRRSLSMFTSDHDVLVQAIGETADLIAFLSESPTLHPEIAFLLRGAVDDLCRGVESILTEPDPCPLDEARHLMEIHSLLRYFTHEPAGLDSWLDIESHRRHGTYGFGKLAQIEGKRLGIPEEHALLERDEYATHSQAIHPTPLGEHAAPAGDPITGLFADLGDLLQHGQRLLQQAFAVTEVHDAGDGPLSPRPIPKTPHVSVAHDLLEKFNRLIGVTPETALSTPKKKVTSRDGTIGGKAIPLPPADTG